MRLCVSALTGWVGESAQIPPVFRPGLLGRLLRPSIAPSAWARGGIESGCAHADGAPAASNVAGRTRRDDLSVDCPV